MKLGPCIIPDEPVGKNVLEQVACIKDPDGYMFEVQYLHICYLDRIHTYRTRLCVVHHHLYVLGRSIPLI